MVQIFHIFIKKKAISINIHTKVSEFAFSGQYVLGQFPGK